MFNFFSRPKANINSITLPDLGWEIQHDDANKKLWVNDARTLALSLNFFDQKPDIPSLKDLSTLRAFYRKLAVQAGGGIIEVALADMQGFAAVKTILKLPQEPTGMIYLASFTIPFRDCSFVVKVQAIEAGATGMRDTLVLDQCMESGRVKLTDQGLQGWMVDPYDPDFKDGKLMNLGEQEAYDAQFPLHPLTQARRQMALVAAGMKLGAELGKLAKS